MGIKEKLQAALKAARDICDAVDAEKRDFTADERAKVAAYLAEAKTLKEQLAAQQGDADMRKALEDMGAFMEGAEDRRKSMAPVAPGKGMTLGEQFVTSPEYAAWYKQTAPGGYIPETAKGLISPPVEFKGLWGQKTVVTGASDTSAGAFVQTDYTGIYEPLGWYQLTLRDLVANRTTTSDLVEFVRQTVQVTQAAPVPEANVTDYSGATGEQSGEKPEGAMAFAKVTEPVKTIAVWIPATKRALSDAAQLRGLIDQELREDCEQELEDQMLNGDGTGENFTGLNNTAGTLVQLFDTDLPTTTRKAKTTLLVSGRQRPTAWLMNPEDWETVELLRDNEGRFYWGGPVTNGPKTLWGVPVVESFYQPQGTAWLGNWSRAVLWDRERATIQVSDSHADFFIRNMVAILCEMRAAFGIIRPSAFVEVTMEEGS